MDLSNLLKWCGEAIGPEYCKTKGKHSYLVYRNLSPQEQQKYKRGGYKSILRCIMCGTMAYSTEYYDGLTDETKCHHVSYVPLRNLTSEEQKKLIGTGYQSIYVCFSCGKILYNQHPII